LVTKQKFYLSYLKNLKYHGINLKKPKNKMDLNPNIKEIEKGLTSKLNAELENNPDFINSDKIDFKKIKGIYEDFLKEMYPNSWKEVRMVIGLKDRSEPAPVLERIMGKLEGKYRHIYEPLEGNNYFEKTE
jgi:hypothetical protein